MRTTLARPCLLLAIMAVGRTAGQVPQPGQPPPPPAPAAIPAEPPDLAEPVLILLDAPYLSDEERKNARVFHGVAREGDLDTPQRRATAALIHGSVDDPALFDESVAVEDRAEGALLRGEAEEVLRLLGDAAPLQSLRAIRIRAEALESLGRSGDAARALEPLVERLRSRQAATAAELVEGVRGLILRAAVRGQEQTGGQDYKAMLELLARARTDFDRLYWPAYLAEAELLFSKDNRREAGQAAVQALTMNQGSAQTWALLGRAAVDGFNFDGVEQVAARLRRLAAPGTSPAAAMLVARARLRQSDPEGALEVLAPALDQFRTHRTLLALRAAALALQYDFDRVDAALAEFEKRSPGSFEGYFEVGRVLSEARQYEPSGRYLAEAVRRAPHRAEPVIELGLMQMQAARDTEALATLSRAVALDPFNSRAKNSLSLVKDLVGFPTVESDHFVVRYRPGQDEVLAREMLDLLETMHDRVTGEAAGGIDHEPAQKTLIDLLPDHRAFSVRIAGITRIHTMAASTGPMIAMEAPREGSGHLVGEYDWLRVVRHEYTHTVTLSRTNNRIPHWFTEASAVFMEDSPRDYSTCQLLEGALTSGSLFNLDEINLAFVRPKKPTDRSQAYAQGHWMYEFIVRTWGQRAPLDLMDRYAAGEREAAAFQTVLGVTSAEFLDRFTAWARGELRVWGMAHREGEPSIAQLLAEEAAGNEALGGREKLERDLAKVVEDLSWSVAADVVPRTEWDPALPDPDSPMVARWLERYPEHADALELAVRLALAESKDEPTPEMIPLLERYAKARPVDPLPHKVLARLFLSGKAGALGGPEAAIPHLEYLDAREQGASTYAIELTRRYAALRDWPRAAEKARRATIVAPFDADARELAATVALQMREYDTAERHIVALTQLEPDRSIHQQRLEAVRRLRDVGR